MYTVSRPFVDLQTVADPNPHTERSASRTPLMTAAILPTGNRKQTTAHEQHVRSIFSQFLA